MAGKWGSEKGNPSTYLHRELQTVERGVIQDSAQGLSQFFWVKCLLPGPVFPGPLHLECLSPGAVMWLKASAQSLSLPGSLPWLPHYFPLERWTHLWALAALISLSCNHGLIFSSILRKSGSGVLWSTAWGPCLTVCIELDDVTPRVLDLFTHLPDKSSGTLGMPQSTRIYL